jgi:hemerythrin superfamily protein
MAREQKTDAIDLLKEDHRKVQDMFEEFKRLHESKEGGTEGMKQDLMDAVCQALTVHAQIEEEIFYPAAREALPDEDDLMNEAAVEHSGAKDLIAQIEEGSAEDPMTCARFMVLSEQIDHHVKEEQEEMFPKILDSEMDTQAIGERLSARKAELEAGDGKAVGGMRRPAQAPRNQVRR